MATKHNTEKFPDREYKKDRRNPDGSDTYWCPMCKDYLAKDHYHKHYIKPFGIASVCKKCLVVQRETRTGKISRRNRLDKTDRNTLEGFLKYFSQRPYLFKETFRTEYSKKTAVEKFNKISKVGTIQN